MTLRSIDTLAPTLRSEVLGRLRGMADGDVTPEGAGEAEITFEVSGGAPGERYAYRLAVAADGAAQRELLDEFRSQDAERSERVVDRALAARVFRAAEEAGLLADDAPTLAAGAQAGPLVPDSLIATLTVRDGTSVRRLSLPAGEPGLGQGLPGESAEVPVGTHMQLPREAAGALRPVLAALSQVESAL
jgi:hypothetical protein